jgi:hypothetical protein
MLGQLMASMSNSLWASETAPIRRRPIVRESVRWFRSLLGITTHAVFMDSRHRPNRRVLGVVYVSPGGDEPRLPLVEESGHPARWSTGRLQLFWMQRVSGDRARRPQIERALRSVTAFWSRRNGLPLDGVRFRIEEKRTTPIDGWSAGVLRRQMGRPWTPIGEAFWERGEFRTTGIR